MKILGIDPGLRHMGWAVIEVLGQNISQLGTGTAHSESTSSLAQRLCELYAQLEAVISKYAPDEAAVEETFMNKGPASALKLGQARAMALLAPARAGLIVAEYAANQIKKTVVGAGHADKSQIAYMVNLQIKGASPQTADEADALAIALTHAHLRKLNHAHLRKINLGAVA